LTLNLPSGRLNARGVGNNVLAALRDAVEDLLVELDRSRKRQKRERQQEKLDTWNGSGGALGRLMDHIEPDHPRDLSKVIRQTLGELYPFVRKQLSRHSQVLERPECDRIDVSDVVEETILNALSRQAEKPPEVPFDRWLFTCAYDVIVSEEDSLAAEAGQVSLDDDVSDPAPPEGPTTGEEIFLDHFSMARFFADELPDGHEREPEQELEGRDFQAAILEAIRQLPGDSKEVLSLLALEGLDERQAARRLRRSEQEVRSTVEGARLAVRAELSARGYET
jgi:RNA polymerase sigma factor (sigma-70 family)